MFSTLFRLTLRIALENNISKKIKKQLTAKISVCEYYYTNEGGKLTSTISNEVTVGCEAHNFAAHSGLVVAVVLGPKT